MMWTTPLVATLCTVASCCLGLNEILHSPECPNYRRSPLWVRLSMFAWCVALFYRAADLWMGIYQGHPQYISPSAVPASVCMALCLYAMLMDTLTKRLPSRTWRRINRLLWLATCGRKSVLTDLALRGFIVVAPNERPFPQDAL